MTYMDNVVDFDQSSSIQELSIEDIDAVAGGPAPLLIVAAPFVGKAVGYAAVAAAGTAAGVAIAKAGTALAKAVK